MSSLAEAVQRVSHEAREAAAKRYGELLSRAHSPEPGDAAEVLMLMDILGRKPMDLEHDAELLRQATEFEAAVAATDGLLARLSTAVRDERAAVANAAAEREALESKLKPALDAAAAAARGARGAVEANGGIRRMTEQGYHQWQAVLLGLTIDQYHARRQAEHRREPAPPPAPQPYSQHVVDTTTPQRHGDTYTASNPARRSHPFAAEPEPTPVQQTPKKAPRYAPQVVAMPEVPGNATEQDLDDEVKRIRRGRQCADHAQGV